MAAGETYDYVVVLKPSRNTAAFDIISQLLILFAALIHANQIVVQPSWENRTYSIIGFALIAGAWIYYRKKGNFSKALFLTAVTMLFIKNYWMLLLYFLSGIFEQQLKFPVEIGFNENGITFNTLPKRRYEWKNIRNVVLKDGIITIDMVSNRIIQKEIQEDISGDLETEFNEFCQHQLRTTGLPAV